MLDPPQHQSCPPTRVNSSLKQTEGKDETRLIKPLSNAYTFRFDEQHQLLVFRSPGANITATEQISRKRRRVDDLTSSSQPPDPLVNASSRRDQHYGALFNAARASLDRGRGSVDNDRSRGSSRSNSSCTEISPPLSRSFRSLSPSFPHVTSNLFNSNPDPIVEITNYYNKQIEQLTDQRNSLVTKCDSFESDKASLLNQRNSFLNESISLTRERNSLRDEVQQLKKTLEESEKVKAEISRKLDQEIMLNVRDTCRFQSEKSHRERLEKELETLRKRMQKVADCLR